MILSLPILVFFLPNSVLRQHPSLLGPDGELNDKYLQLYKLKLTMGRIHQVIAATPLGVLARGGIVATLEVQTLRSSQAIGAAAISR